MRLRVFTPREQAVDEPAVTRVSGEGLAGSFTLLEHHVDVLAAIVPGLLGYVDQAGRESFLAVDEGLLVKAGPDVRVVTRRAVTGELGELRRAVEEEFKRRSEHEQRARGALRKMEADFLRRFVESREHG